MFLPCAASMFFLVSPMHVENSIFQIKSSANNVAHYSCKALLPRYNPKLLSTGDKRINLTLNKEFSLHALHRGNAFLVSARYTF